MFFGCVAGALLAATAHVGAVPARICFALGAGAVQLRLLCNMLDGMVAVESGRASRVGELFNELPDRVSDAATLIGAGYSAGGFPVLGFVGACMAMFTAYVRAEGKIAGARQEFCGPMAKPQRMFVMTVAALFCAVAPASWQARWGAAGAGILSIALGIIILGTVITVIRRLCRIVSQLEGA
ncbi:MAG TPA: CDP-alcohol phosphatidyltransferase family protein [Tepidisphaeraceae bacterium]|nr:CDP-alcohol phosphatidyltransferase family protein [Tepidisphaeraceae bacterium]